MNVCKNTVTVFKDLFKIILTRSKGMGVEITNPRLAKRQKYWCNIVMKTPEGYYEVFYFMHK